MRTYASRCTHAHVCVRSLHLLPYRCLLGTWHGARAWCMLMGKGSPRGRQSRRFHAVVFLLWVIVCASAFLNKMPLSLLWGPLFPVPWVVFLCRFYPLYGRLQAALQRDGKTSACFTLLQREKNELPESSFREIKKQDKHYKGS